VAAFERPIAPECAASGQLAEAVTPFTGEADDDYRRVARSLLDGSPLFLESISCPEVPDGALSVDQTLTLMEVGAWLEELAAGLEVLRLRPGEPRLSSTAATESATPTKVTV
jgi:hypothetical protein